MRAPRDSQVTSRQPPFAVDCDRSRQWQTRRHFLQQCPMGLGAIAAATMGSAVAHAGKSTLGKRTPHHQAHAKNVIYIHLAGSPSQLELFDYKPELQKRNLQPCPDEWMKGQRFAFIKGHPQLLGPTCKFMRQRATGRWFSELIPHVASISDQLTIVRSMQTDQFNHAPAQLFLLTGQPRSGYPSIGSWVTYGLGTENENLPGFVVLLSGGNHPSAGKAAWGSGFLPGVYQGVSCRVQGDPILFLSNPPGMSRSLRRDSLDVVKRLNEIHAEEFGHPETRTRIEQYELAFRMQIEAPEVMDISRESQQTLDRYQADPAAASFANNCLLARRLVEQGVRFVQLFDWGWDVHGTGAHDDLITQFPKKCREMDRPVAALITDLRRRGLLEETLVIWGGEFGRTAMNEARHGSRFLGRDHHPHAFTMLFAGGGMQPGLDFGETDDFGYFVTQDAVQVHDIQATLLHLLGLDAKQLTFPFQGLKQRLIGPSDAAVVRHELLV